MPTTNPLIWRVLCRARLLHRWTTMSSPDGERYRACAVCRKERFARINPVY